MVSIIIPTRNRAESLKSTLDSVQKAIQNSQSYHTEVIVVDNGSTDGTKEICTQFIPLIKNFRYVYEEIPGLLSGRHRGLFEAKGDILAYIDDDVVVTEKWLPTIHRVMEERKDIAFLTGPDLPKYEGVFPDWIDQFWTSTEYGGKMLCELSLLDLGDKIKEVHPNYVFGLNFTVRKSILIKLCGFHPDNLPEKFQMFQGDGETGLTMKAYAFGEKALYHPDVKLHHVIPSDRLTIHYFEKRAFYQGVCDSFTSLRKNEQNIEKVEKKPGFKKRLKNLIKKTISSTKIHSESPIKNQSIKEKVMIKKREGFEYHQKMFMKPIVHDWVLKDNYLDYKLPIHD